MTAQYDELIDTILSAQRQVTETFGQSQRWLDLDLTMGQLKTLMTLGRQATATVGQAASALHVSRPAASTMVDGLVRLGLVERQEDAEDRRRTLVDLTAAGRDIVVRLLNVPESLRDPMRRMSLEDLAALAQGTQALAAALLVDTRFAMRAPTTAEEPAPRISATVQPNPTGATRR